MIVSATSGQKDGSCPLKLMVVHVKPSSSVRNLGVLFNLSLSNASHISSVVKTSFFHLRNIARLRTSLTLADSEILIIALITSRLDYCNALFLGLLKKLIARLQYVQNSAARVLTSTRCSARYSSNAWSSLATCGITYTLFISFKALNGLAPPYLSHLLYSYSPPRSLRSSELGILSFPCYQLSIVGGRSFSVNGPKQWNSLPPLSLRNLSSLSTFKTQLKTYLSIMWLYLALCVCIFYLDV